MQLLYQTRCRNHIVHSTELGSLPRRVYRMWKVKWETAAEMTQWEAAVQRHAKQVREVEESTRQRQRQYSRGGAR